jgi:hypothetical protein
MKFETQHSFGDVVYNIWRATEKVFVECGFCESGKIIGKDGTLRSCPECRGRNGEYHHKNLRWRIVGQLTIGEIRVEARAEDLQGFNPDTIFDNYGPQEGFYKESYMCRETGIGSGSVYRGEVLFKTKEEAQAECDRLNEEEAGNVL